MFLCGFVCALQALCFRFCRSASCHPHTMHGIHNAASIYIKWYVYVCFNIVFEHVQGIYFDGAASRPKLKLNSAANKVVAKVQQVGCTALTGVVARLSASAIYSYQRFFVSLSASPCAGERSTLNVVSQRGFFGNNSQFKLNKWMCQCMCVWVYDSMCMCVYAYIYKWFYMRV